MILYAFEMAAKRPPTRETLARNLRVLMEAKDWTQRELASASGVSQRSISNVLKETQVASIEMADSLAKPFGLQGWHLILPDLPMELVNSTSIGRLVRAYTGGSRETRTYMDSIAERELKHGTDRI